MLLLLDQLLLMFKIYFNITLYPNEEVNCIEPSRSVRVPRPEHRLSGVYTGEKTLHVFAVASDGDLKRWEDFY